MQNERYELAVKTLVKASITNIGVKNGGTKESQEIYKRASDLYASKTKNMKDSEIASTGATVIEASKGNKLSALHVTDEDGKPLGKTKMQRDPIFLSCIDEV
jgi:hypothetical protein